MHILIVEDDLTSLKMLSAVLEAEGHTVAAATNGAEALEALKTHAPDIVVLDLRLPVTDGLDLGRILRDAGLSMAVPLVAVTSFAGIFSETQALSSGMAAYFVKPIDTRTFGKAIAALASVAQQPD